MEVIEFGMVTSLNTLQSAKAPPPMRLTELGMVTLATSLHPAKAYSPTLVTESGISTMTSVSGSISGPKPSLLLQRATFCLKRLETTESAERPTSATVSSFPSFLSPKIISTKVVSRLSSCLHIFDLLFDFSHPHFRRHLKHQGLPIELLDRNLHRHGEECSIQSSSGSFGTGPKDSSGASKT